MKWITLRLSNYFYNIIEDPSLTAWVFYFVRLSGGFFKIYILIMRQRM